MTDSLRRTLRELGRQEALAAVGQFAAAISHELRNALTAVRLDLQRLQERAEPAHPDRALIGRVLRNVHRLDAITTGSLRIARTTPETMRALAIEGVLHGAASAAEPAFLDARCRIEIVPLDGTHARVRGEAASLEHLFLNLLINAAHAMKPDGVARMSIDLVDGSVIVRIADTGHGIAADQLGRIGQPFFSSKPNGTGLGFSIAQQIAAVHGGHVTVAETGGDGTTVSVTLPRLAT